MLRCGVFLVGFMFLPVGLLAQPGGVSGGNRPPANQPVPTRPLDRPADPAGTPATTQPTPPEGDSGPKEPMVDEAIELFKKGEVQRALDKLTEAAEKNNKLPPAKVMLARMFANAGQAAQARTIMEQAAMETPDHPDVFLTFGNMALQENRLADAHLWFQEGLTAMTRMSWNEDQQRNIRMNCLNGLASVAERRGQWQVAHDRLKDMLALEAQNGAIRNRLGQALFLLEQRDAAADALEQAGKDDSNLPPYPISMAQLYLRIRNKPKAEEWFNYGLKLDGKSIPTKVAFASFLLDEDRLDEAGKLLNEVVTQEPKNLEGRLLQAMLARLKKDNDGAERILNGLLVDRPDDIGLKNQLALVLIASNDEGKRRKAAELAEANLKAQPRNAELASTFGWVLFKQNRADEAEKVFQQIFQLGNVTADTAYFYAQVLADKGKTDDAKRLLQSAIDSQGRFFNRADARDWLKTLERRS